MTSGSPTHAAQENIRAVAAMDARAAARRTWPQRLTDRVLAIASHEITLAAHVVVFTIWLSVNSGLIGVPVFDPFPFPVLTMIVSLEAIFLSLFVLASYDRLTQEADHRAHLDLHVSLLAEQEMTLVLQMLKEICDHLGLKETVASRKFKELAERTDLEELGEHLERSAGLLINERGADSATTRPEVSVSNKHDNKPNDSNPRKQEKQESEKKGPSGGNSGAGRSGKEDMGGEKPTTSPELGSRKPGTT